MPAAAAEDLPVLRLVNPKTGAEFEYRGKWLRTGKATDGDVRRGLARFRGDKVWLPYPPGVQIQLDAGNLQIAGQYAARAEAEAAMTPEALMPKGNASHEVWVKYAISQGMERAEAAELTREQIKSRFTAPRFDPDAAPAMDGPFEVLS